MPDINAALRKLRDTEHICMECGYPMLDGEVHDQRDARGDVTCWLDAANAARAPRIFFDRLSHNNSIRVLSERHHDYRPADRS